MARAFADSREIGHVAEGNLPDQPGTGPFRLALRIATYVWARLKALERLEAHRAVATFHSFCFFGLVFLLPGFVGANLPEGFAALAAYGDFATALLAILALVTVRLRFLFWPLIWALNLVGLADLIMDTVNAVSIDLLAFRLLLRPARTPARSAGTPTPLATE